MSENNENGVTPVAEQTSAKTATQPLSPISPDESASLLTGAKTESEQGAAKQESESEAAKGEKVESPVIPEKYEFNIPDGMQLDEKLAGAVEPVLKELQLTQTQADKLTEVWANYQTQQVAQNQEAFANLRKDWQAQVKADPDLGGDKFAANIQLANETLTRFGVTPEFLTFLDEWGLSNHPEMVRFVVNVGKTTAEDRPSSTSGAPAAASLSEGERAYQYADKPAGRNR